MIFVRIKIFIFLCLPFICFSKEPKITIQAQTNHSHTPYPVNFQIYSITTEAAAVMAEKVLRATQPTLYQDSKNNLLSLTSYLSQNKIIFSIVGLVTSYYYIVYKIIEITSLVNSRESWCNWKQEIPLDSLLILQQSDLAKDLVTDIQKKYADPRKLDNYINSFVSFYLDINKELDELNSFLKLVSWIKFCKAERLFQLKPDLIEAVKEKINKIGHIKGIFGTLSTQARRSLISTMYQY